MSRYESLKDFLSLNYMGTISKALSDQIDTDLAGQGYELGETRIITLASPLTGEELFKRKDSLEMLSTLSRRRYSEGGFIRDFLMESVIWLDKLNVDQIIELSGRAEGFYRKYE